MGHPHNLMEITQPEAEALLRRSGTAIIPTGSIEQHGPHMPCGTDTYAATLIAQGVAERLGALVVPFAPMGVTPFHMGFSGTISLQPATFVQVMEDVAASLLRHGARRLVILNWHEGNTAAIGVAASQIHHRQRMQVVVAQACYVADELYGAECGGLTHAGELEVLPVMVYDASLLRLERATNSSPMSGGRKIDAIRRNRSIQPVLTDIRQIAPTGWYGDPRKATPEKARRVVDGVASQIAANVQAVWEAMAELEGG